MAKTLKQLPNPPTHRIQGPQLTLSRSNLYFENHINRTQTDDVIVTNTGSTAVFYEWKKFARPDFIKAKRSDGITRFHCHYGKGMLRPTESKRFVFSFVSKKSGIFTEEWDLLTDPLLVEEIPQLVLTGRAMEKDRYLPLRHALEQDLVRTTVLHTAQEMLGDIVRSVRTPTPPPPDLVDPVQCQEQFESKNLEFDIWHTNDVMEMLWRVEYRVRDLAQKELEEWDLTIQGLKKLIQQLPESFTKQLLFERVDFIVNLAREKPLHRSNYWELGKNVLEQISDEIPKLNRMLRQEMEIEEYEFYQPWELTEEELEKMAKEKQDKEIAKQRAQKGKKGAKSEEDILRDKQLFKDRLLESIQKEFADKMIENLDMYERIVALKQIENFEKLENLPVILQNTNRLNKHMKNSNIANYQMTQHKMHPLDTEKLGQLYRKYKLSDIDMEGKRVLIRLNFNIKLSEEEWYEEEEENQDDDEESQPRIVKHCEDRYVIEANTLEQAFPTIRYCIDHLAKYVMLIGSMGPRAGEYREEWNMKPVKKWLKEQLETKVVYFKEFPIEEFEEKIDELPENILILAENTAFCPEEFGYTVTREGEVYKCDWDKIIRFREELTQYFDIFVNEYYSESSIMESNLDAFCNVRNAGCSTMCIKSDHADNVMGLALEKEIININVLFSDLVHPFVMLVGGDEDCKVSVIQRLVLIYALLDLVDHVVIAGKLLDAFKDEQYKEFVEKINSKAQQKGVKISLPLDFQYAIVLPPPDPEESKEGEPQDSEEEEDEEQEPPQWHERLDEIVSVQIDEELSEEQQEQLAQKTKFAYGLQTSQQLENILLQCRRLFWVGSLDLFSTRNPDVSVLNKLTIDFLRNNRDAKEIMVGGLDTRQSIQMLIVENENQQDEEQERQSAIGSVVSNAELSDQEAPQILTPEEIYNTLVTHRFDQTQLVVEILSGRKIPPLDYISEHPKPKEKSPEEDTSYLDIIQ